MDERCLSTSSAVPGHAKVTQSYSPDLVPENLVLKPSGPAIFINNSSEILRDLCGDAPLQRLTLLAEVYCVAP